MKRCSTSLMIRKCKSNPNEIPLRLIRIAIFTISTITSDGEDVEKLESSCFVDKECKIAQPLWKTVWQFPGRLNAELPYDTAILVLSKYPELKTGIQKIAPCKCS